MAMALGWLKLGNRPTFSLNLAGDRDEEERSVDVFSGVGGCSTFVPGMGDYYTIMVKVLAAVKNHTFFGDSQGKGGLGEMPSAAVGAQSCACIPVNRGSAGNPPCDAPSGWTATERTRSADLTVLSTVTSRTKR
jgi:hypothetical protein